LADWVAVTPAGPTNRLNAAAARCGAADLRQTSQ
jgi:hypothetical protein